VDDAEEALFGEYAAQRLASLRRLGFLVCGDWHLAEDAVSTVMAKLYVSWRSISRTDNIDAYVRRMLIRAIVDERRRPWRRESPAEYPLSPPPRTTGTDTLDDRMVLREALSRMPPRRRAVLVLRYFEELSVEETAAAMGCSTGTVKSQTARALAALRDLIPADYLLQERGTG
jgi:RNA polymerase sigma-70 factor (sigma-E family)